MSTRSPHGRDSQVDVPVYGGNVRITGREDLVASFLERWGVATPPPVERPPTDSTGNTSQVPPRLVSDGGEHRDRQSSEQNLEGLPDL